jgi:hypothetical protein
MVLNHTPIPLILRSKLRRWEDGATLAVEHQKEGGGPVIEDFLEYFDADGLEDQLMDTRGGMSAFIEMISDILRCISEIKGGFIVEYEEIREFLASETAFLCCTNEGCEIIVKKMSGKRPFKLVSVRVLTIHNMEKSFLVH